MKEHTQEELIALEEHIVEDHYKDYATISYKLGQAIYWLHYVASDEIPDLDRKNLCESLFRLSECFYEAHKIREIRNRLASKKLTEDINKMGNKA